MFIRSWKKMVLVLAITAASLGVQADWNAPHCYRPEAIQAGAAVTLKNYPDADTVLLADTEAVRYNPDGTSEKVDDCYEKILTQKGKDDRDSLSFHYMLPYNQVSVEKVEVIRGSQTIPVDLAKQSRTQVESGQMGSNIYNPNSKTLTVQIPDLLPGDILHYVIREKTMKPYIPNTFSEYFVLQSTSPVLDYRVIVDAPASRPLQSVVVKDEVKGTITASQTKSGDRVVYEWRARNVPRVFEEPGMPPMFTVVQRILVSTTPAWKDISQWYWNLCQPHLEKTTPGMIAKVKELTANLKDDDAKIRALYYYVAHQIRYMGLTTETDAPGYEPHDVNITFDNKYGVCRDKAALLVTMLRIAGYNARPVLFYVGPKKDAEVPNNYFNHAIVGVEFKPGDYMLMDPTDENSRDPFPAYLCNKSYLVARPDGDILRTSAVVPAEKNLLRINTTGELEANGTLKASSILNFDGVNDGVYRDAFLKWTPEKREEFFAAGLRKALPGAVVRKIAIIPAKLDDSGIPLEVRLSYEVPDFLISGSDAAMLRLPWLGTQFGMVNFVIGSTGLEKRRFPMQIETTCGVQEKFGLKFTDFGKPVLMPQYAPVDQPDFQWRQQVGWNNGVMSGESLFTMRSMEIPVAGYTALKEQLRQMEFNRRKMPLFAFDSLMKNADVLVLNKETQIEVKDESSWIKREKISKKILTYSGKKSASELKFSYNPVWTEQELVSASVVSPQGARQTVKTQEINLMDAGWVGEAPRYPAAKVKVVSLPNVEPGSVIEYETKTTFRNRSFFADFELFKHRDPVVKQSFTLSVPKKLADKLQIATYAGAPEAKVEESASDKRWTWGAVATPKVKDEMNQPPLFSFCPMVAVSLGDWTGYAETLNKAMITAAADQPQCVAKARELAEAAGKKRADQLAAINQYVLKTVRLAGPDFTKFPLSCLSKADVTLKDGYGNMADRAVVLYAMLKDLGFKPEFAVGGSLAPVDSMYNLFRNIPSETLFNETLVRVECDGEALYLNADNHYGRPGICRSEDDPALDLISGKIIRVVLPERLRDATVQEYSIDFDLDGNALITRKSSYFGTDFSDFVRTYSEMTPEKKRRYFMEEAAGISQAAQIVKSDADIASYPAAKTLTVKVPRYAVRDGNYLYFSLPGAALRKMFPSGTDKRVTPYFFERAVNLQYKVSARVAGTTARVMMQPLTWQWQAPDAAGQIVFSAVPSNGNQFTVDSRIDLRPAIVPAYRFGEYLWAGDKIGSPALWQVTVELPAVKAPVSAK